PGSPGLAEFTRDPKIANAATQPLAGTAFPDSNATPVADASSIPISEIPRPTQSIEGLSMTRWRKYCVADSIEPSNALFRLPFLLGLIPLAMPGHRWARPHRILLYLVLVLALALRCQHLTDPAWDYHNWRQTITLMVARDYSRHFDLLHPTLLWISNGAPAYFNAEFSVQSVIAAILYRLTRESDAVARLVVVAFSLAGIAWLYQLLHRRAGPLAAFLGAL